MAKRRKKRRVRRTRRKNSWYKQPIRHKRASRKGWRRRRSGKKGYKKARRLRGSVKKSGFPLNRNNTKLWLTTIGIGAAGLLAAKMISHYADKALSKSGKNPLAVAAGNLTPIVVPVAASFLMLRYGSKLIKNPSLVKSLSTAFGMMGVWMALKMFVVPKLPAGAQGAEAVGDEAGLGPGGMGPPEEGGVNGVRGYVRSMRGYVNVPMLSSYAASRGMGAAGRREVPYGTGQPLEERTYNQFRWQGNLTKSVFE